MIHGTTFVLGRVSSAVHSLYFSIYMIPPENVIQERVIPARIRPGCCTGDEQEFHSGEKFCNRTDIPELSQSKNSLTKSWKSLPFIIVRAVTSTKQPRSLFSRSQRVFIYLFIHLFIFFTSTVTWSRTSLPVRK